MSDYNDLNHALYDNGNYCIGKPNIVYNWLDSQHTTIVWLNHIDTDDVDDQDIKLNIWNYTCLIATWYKGRPFEQVLLLHGEVNHPATIEEMNAVARCINKLKPKK